MIFLMILAFISFWIIVGNGEREPNWRLALIQSAILWGTYLILGSEILSLFSALNRKALVILWSLPILCGFIWLYVWLKRGKILRLPVVYRRHSWFGFVLDMLVILILAITALVAFVSPPNSNAAMVTRMSRVAHWTQNRSLDHYPTSIESQNSNTSGAEQIALNFYILGGNDRAVNFVAWIGFAGSVAYRAKQLQEMLGGDITVSSSPGQGSTFSLTIETGSLKGIQMVENPVEAGVRLNIKAPSRDALANESLDCRILLAEDGPDNQRLISFILKKAGARVTLAENGQIAYDKALTARDRGEPFDVILMDMQMPVMDGYTATQRLRDADYSGPIIALTAHAMEGDGAKCRGAGCDDYLTKPIHREKFLATIKRWLTPVTIQSETT